MTSFHRSTPEGDAIHLFVPPERVKAASEQAERELAYATKAQTHLWNVIASYRINDATARTIATGRGASTPVLDTENLMHIVVGCLICEQPLDSRLINRRCPGEPPA